MKLVKVWDSNCNKTMALLDHYLSHELTVESTEEVVRHLEICPQCLEKFKFREVVKKRLREAIVDEKAPPALRKRVLRLIRINRGSWFSKTFGDQKLF